MNLANRLSESSTEWNELCICDHWNVLEDFLIHAIDDIAPLKCTFVNQNVKKNVIPQPIKSMLNKRKRLDYLIFHLTRTKNQLKKVCNFGCQSCFCKPVFVLKTANFWLFWPEIITLTCRICRGFKICHTHFTPT